MSSKAVSFTTDIVGVATKVHPKTSTKALHKFCANVAKEYPLVKKQWCIAAGHYLANQGKKVTKQTVLQAAKKFAGGVAIPSLKMVNSTLSGGRSNGSGYSISKNGGGIAIGGTTTTAPVALSTNINRRSRPRMRVRGENFVINHSEMLGSVLTGSPSSNVTAYRCTGFRANPGMSTVFPWLSSMAVNFEKYRFTKLRFTLVPLVSTAYNGRIGVGFDFDSSDAAPGNRQEFYSLTTHCENMPWQPCGVDVKCDSTYRFTGTHVASDNKLIDLGQVVVMSDSISNGGTIAAAFPIYDLIVDYEVELIEPQQALFATQLFTGATTLTSGIPLGTGADTTTIVGPTVVNSTTVTNTVLTFVFPAGTYSVGYFISWSTGTASLTPTVPTTGASSKLSFNSVGTAGYGLCEFTSSSECSLVLTVSGVAYNANLNKLNVVASRVASQVFASFTS